MAFVVIEMPEAQEMRKKLLAISQDPDLLERLYPALIRSLSGKRMVSDGVVHAFRDAIYGYIGGGASLSQLEKLADLIPAFVEILVEKRDLAREISQAIRDSLRES